MRELLTADDIYSSIVLLQAEWSGAILILEGSTDCSVFDEFVDGTACRTLPAHKKENAIGAIVLADRNNGRGILVIVDADYDHLLGRQYQTKNLCLTEYHDLEVVMLLSGVMSRLVRQYCDRDRHDQFILRVGASSLADVVLAAAGRIGLLRMLSIKQSLDLNFQVLNFSVFIETSTLTVIRSDLIKHVIDGTKNCKATASHISAEIAKIESKRPDVKQLANGHDVSEVIGIAIKSVVGQCAPAVADPRNVERMLRMAFSASDFVSTAIFAWIKRWEQSNPSFKVLRSLP